MDFKEKVVLITGATGGIGSAIATQLSQEKCKLALIARKENQLRTLTDTIQKNNSNCIYKTCDNRQQHEVEEAVEYTENHFQKIDVAILTAGILTPNPIETFNSTIIKESLEINFFGTLYFIEALFPLMKRQQSGTIAALSTLPDRRGVAGWGAYGASKAALSWLMESIRAEAKQKYNINMITVKPGSVQTPMIKGYHRVGALSPEKAAEYIINGIKKEKKIIQFPLSQVLMIRLTDLFPPFTYDALPLELQKGEGYPEIKDNNSSQPSEKK
ncbi:MAG: SDR family NAD(P)-dependent oxidoreductase [Methanobacteriota archaeon]